MFEKKKMIIHLAWKNVWRNKLRSFVMLLAIVLGLTGGTFLVGFMNGWVDERIQDVIENEMTHLQINSAAFIDQPDIEHSFPLAHLEERINKIESVVAASPRVIVNGMVASAHNMLGIQLFGIEPAKERQVSGIYRYIADSLGSYFEDGKANQVVIGAGLAEELKIKLRSKIVVSIVDVNGEQTSAAFRVCGIFDLKNPLVEKSRIYVRASDLRTLTALDEGDIHELALKLTDNANATCDRVKAAISPFLEPGEVIRSWKEISMMMAVYTEFLGYELMVIVSLILFALGFGIVNTILMAVMERRRELSMMMAIGMDKRQVLHLIMLETIMLTITGGFVGMIIGYTLILITNRTGIDISASMGSIGEIGFPTVIHPVISVPLFLGIAALVMLTGVVSAIYPARNATSLNPAEGIRG